MDISTKPVAPTALQRFDERLASARRFRETLVEVIAEIGEPTEVGLLHAVWGAHLGGSLDPAVTGPEPRPHPYDCLPDVPYLWLTTSAYDSAQLRFGLHNCRRPRAQRYTHVDSPAELRPTARRLYDQLLRPPQGDAPHATMLPVAR